SFLLSATGSKLRREVTCGAPAAVRAGWRSAKALSSWNPLRPRCSRPILLAVLRFASPTSHKQDVCHNRSKQRKSPYLEGPGGCRQRDGGSLGSRFGGEDTRKAKSP